MKHTVTKKYTDAWKEVKLTEASRDRIEKSLMEYAAFHGVPGADTEGVRVEDERRSIEEAAPRSASLLTGFTHFKPMTALILAAILVSGGTSFAAEQTLPGDALYPIKVEINEGIKSMFSFGAEAEARLQAALVEERLKEAEALAARGKLTAESSADIEARLESHTEATLAEAAVLEASGNAEVATDIRMALSATLQAYARVLGGVAAESTTEATESLLIEVEKEHNATVEADADLDITVDGILDGVINVKTSDDDASATEAGEADGGASLEIDADVETDTSVDTGILDLDATTDTRVKTSTGLGL